MTRYKFADTVAVEDSDGSWVLYSEAAEQIRELRHELESATDRARTSHELYLAAEARAREAEAKGWAFALEACARSLEAGADAGGRQTETGRVLAVSADKFREQAKRLAAQGRR